jgi:tetratricopeptide (TPR) repeat protein
VSVVSALGAAALAAALATGEVGPVLVIPPEGRGGAPPGWIGHAVAELLPRALQRAGVLAASGGERRQAQAALGFPPGTLTRATAVRLAEGLGSPRLVVGSWDTRGADVVLSLRLVDVGRASTSAPLVSEGPLSGLARAVHGLAWDAALAGPAAPAGTKEALVRAADAVPFEALRALGEGLAAGDAAAQAQGVRRALRAAPSFEEAALALGRILVDGGRLEEARDALRSVAAGSPFAREARMLEGVALLGEGLSREADVLFAGLVSERPTAAALSNRAVARLRQGPGAGGASVLLRQGLERAPASLDLPFNLGWALLVEGEPEAAAFWLRGAVRRDPGDAQGRLALSWALASAGRADEAEEQWRAAAAAAPSLEPLRRPDLSRRLERVLASEVALRVDPAAAADAVEAGERADRAESLLAGGELAGAVAELERAALLDPWSPRPHVLLARAHRRAGRNERALDALRAALWSRDDPAVRREAADVLRSLGREGEARALLGAP